MLVLWETIISNVFVQISKGELNILYFLKKITQV